MHMGGGGWPGMYVGVGGGWSGLYAGAGVGDLECMLILQ